MLQSGVSIISKLKEIDKKIGAAGLAFLQKLTAPLSSNGPTLAEQMSNRPVLSSLPSDQLSVSDSNDGAGKVVDGTDLKLFAQKQLDLVDAGQGHAVALNVGGLDGKHHKSVAQRLLATGQGEDLLLHLDQFKDLDAATAFVLINRGASFSVCKHAKSFEESAHDEIANAVIDRGHGKIVQRFVNNFVGLSDETKARVAGKDNPLKRLRNHQSAYSHDGSVRKSRPQEKGFGR